jgi:predicted transposase/invertase (TIGR01784 family)
MLSEKIVINGVKYNFQDLFDILIDFIFKAIFTDLKIANSFLSALLNRKVELKVMNKNVLITSDEFSQKEIILDLLGEETHFVVDDKGEDCARIRALFNLEPQIRHHEDHKDRKLYYSVKILNHTLFKDDEYDKLPEAYVIFINKDNSDAVELIDRAYLCYESNGKEYNSKLQIIDINLRKLNKIPADMDETLKTFLYFFATGNNDRLFTVATKNFTDKNALNTVDMLLDATFWLKCNPVIKAMIMTYAKSNPIPYFSTKELINMMPSFSTEIYEIAEEAGRKNRKKYRIEDALEIAINAVKHNLDTTILQMTIPDFVLKKLNANMSVDDAYDLFMREMISFALSSVKSRKRIAAICQETGFSRALIKRLKSNPKLVLDDDNLLQLEKIAWDPE